MIQFIAEIGVNHQGSFEKAIRMVKASALCGATHVKFQKYNPIKVLGKNHPALKDAHQLSWQELTELSSYSKKLGLQFGCSVFNVNDIAIVDRISDYHKIASRMNQNQEFIAKINDCHKPTFMSIQPSTASQRIPDRFKLMWCVREYPTTYDEIIKYPYSTSFGLSSHCPEWKASLYAAQKGATVFENHLVESKEEKGCDVSSSLTFEDYKTLIHEVKSLHLAVTR